MKLQVVKTNKGYVAISDEDIKEGDCIWYKNTNMIGFAGEDNIDKFYYAKIIATDSSFKLEGIPQFELPAVLDGAESTDLIELAEAKYPYINTPIEDVNKAHNIKVDSKRIAFIQGYKAAQEKGCYSIEDMRKAISDTFRIVFKNSLLIQEDSKRIEYDIINSLNQPKKLVAIEVDDMKASAWVSNEKGHGRVNINLPIATKSEEYPDGLLTVKQYFYE